MNDTVMTWILSMSDSPWTYLALAGVLALGGVLPFLPSQSLLVALTTLMCAREEAALTSLLWIFLSASLGVILGDFLTYGCAKWFDIGSRQFLNGEKTSALRTRMATRFVDHPYWIVTTGRLVSMGRMATTLACVDADVDARTFAKLSGVAALVWTIYSMVIALLMGVWADNHPVLITCVAVGVSLVLGYIVGRIHEWWLTRHAHRRV